MMHKTFGEYYFIISAGICTDQVLNLRFFHQITTFSIHYTMIYTFCLCDYDLIEAVLASAAVSPLYMLD